MNQEQINKLIFKIAGTNVGAYGVMQHYMVSLPLIDVSSEHIVGYNLKVIDELNITGTGIWGLYKDNCGECIWKFAQLIQGFKLGIITKGRIQEASMGRDKGLCITQDEWSTIQHYVSLIKTFASLDDWKFIQEELSKIRR